MNAKLDNSDEDDFFDNPLKHLLPKVKSAKSSRNRLLTIEKNSDWNKGELEDDDDDLMRLTENTKREDPALLKVEKEINELENFSKTGLPAVSTNMKPGERKRRKKALVEDGDDIKPVFIDDCVAEADDSLIVKEPFVMEPHCSIEICDLERCDTQLIRWKMNEPVDGIAKKYALKWDCLPDNVALSLKSGKEVFVKNTPYELAFSEKDVNYLSVYKGSHSENTASNRINIKWQLSELSKPIISSVSVDIPFKILKRNFAVDNGLDVEKVALVFDGERIKLEETAETLGIEDGDCIDVYLN